MQPEPVKVDVGTPAFNRPGMLVEAIESVLAQTLTSFRLTISDNSAGGGDVERVVRPYLSDPRVSYVATGGVPQHANMTRLIQTGDGPYVGLLHDDDLWEPDFLKRRVEFLDAHPECGFAFGGNYEMDEHGRRTNGAAARVREGVVPSEEMLNVLYERNPVAPPSLLVRRTAYEAVGPHFAADFPRYFDYEMLFRLASRFPAGYLAGEDSGYRFHTGSVTSASRLFGEEHLRALDRGEEIMRAASTDFRLDPALRARVRSFYELRACLDLLEQGRRRRAFDHLVSAVRLHPRSLGDHRFFAGTAALVLGPMGRRALQFARGERDSKHLERKFGVAS